MKRTYTFRLAIVLLAVFLTGTMAYTQTIYGLTTDNKLVSFNAATPNVIISTPSVSGVKMGQTLVGMDVRPATGEIFALGYDNSNDSATVYTLNPMSGVATPKAISIKLTGMGTTIGFDFNPTVDRIRIVSKTGKSYRLNPNNGALAATDSTLRYAAADINAGKIPGVTAAAYTNSYIGATSTGLYNYDETQKTIVFQNPPNDGVLNTQPSISGITTSAIISDIDIYTNPTTFASTVYAAVRTGTMDSLFTLNLSTGVMTRVGAISTSITDIAVAIDRTLPPLQGRLAYGLSFTGGNSAFNLLQFDLKNPSVIRSATVITGLKTGQMLMGLDVRPQDNRIYALGYRSSDSVATIYTLNDTTSALTVYAGADSFKIALGTAQAAFDFNPSANRLRIIGASNRQNYRLNLTVNPITITVDTALTFKAGDVNFGRTPNVVSGAYTNSYNGATSTQLYDIETSNNIVANQNSANGGFLATAGALGITLDPNDLTTDFDIFSTLSPLADSAYLAANVAGGNGFDNLYTVNLTSGAATLVGRIGLGIAVRNIAIRLPNIKTSIADLPRTLKATIYPNPTATSVQIIINNDYRGVVNVQAFNLNGAAILQQRYDKQVTDFQAAFDTSHLPNGTYLVRITTEKEVGTLKLVKMQ